MGRKPKEKSEPPKESNILNDEQRQALHLNQHVPAYQRALDAKKRADADLKNVCKLIKSEGGSVEDVKLTLQLQTPEGEEAFRSKMARQAEVAAWNGVGVQLDLMSAKDMPAEDRAFGEGKRAGMRGEPARPPYDPSVPQYKRWMEGHSEGNAVLASEGFKKLEKAA